jgi:hypothetical protein
MIAKNVPQDHQALQDLKENQDLKVRKVRLDQKDLQDLQVRVEKLENKALQENQALQDLLVRLESVLANAQQHWYHKTTLLKWMIIILGLIVMDRLLSLYPQIAPIVMKLL